MADERPRRQLVPRWLTAIWASHPLAVVTGVVVLVLAGVVGLLWPVTDVIAAHDVGLITGPLRAARLQTAREAVRTQLLTLGAGLFAAGALVFTARNFTLSRRSHELAEQAQVTERFTKAIGQLGSGKLDVRIGSIYALERIARDSPRDHPAVMEVLTAFVRDHSHDQWPRRKADGNFRARTTRPDVQAALTVIGRRDPARDQDVIDLGGANLTNAALAGARLAGAYLDGANLTSALLHRADLSGAFLRADLSETSLYSANLQGAHLMSANLTNAKLWEANLSGAWLLGANLTGTDFYDADLTGANLAGARRAGADFAGAKWDEGKPPPAGWKRDPDSGKLKRRADPPPDGETLPDDRTQP